jgi:hypothetical protein
MPSLLAPPFPPLISALPVQEHSFALDAGFWQPKFQAAGQGALWTTIFGELASVRISRNRLLQFDYPTQEQKCAEILLWGYPRNQRGRVSGLLQRLAELPPLATSDASWPRYFDAFAPVGGIGISTITKLAYFYDRTFGGYGALILDSRVMDNAARWDEVSQPVLSRPVARTRYPVYLRVMHEAAGQIPCSAAQLELFLFALGHCY